MLRHLAQQLPPPCLKYFQIVLGQVEGGSLTMFCIYDITSMVVSCLFKYESSGLHLVQQNAPCAL